MDIQNPRTAQFGAMPASIAPPLVDVVADLEAIAALLHDLLTGAYTPAAPAENRTLHALLDHVHELEGALCRTAPTGVPLIVDEYGVRATLRLFLQMLGAACPVQFMHWIGVANWD
jgi:hypothetical protein